MHAGAALSCERSWTSCAGCDPGKDCKVWGHDVSFRGNASGGSQLHWHVWKTQDWKEKKKWMVWSHWTHAYGLLFVCVCIVALTAVSPERCQRKLPCWLAWADSADDDCESEEESYWPGREKKHYVNKSDILGPKIKAKRGN